MPAKDKNLHQLLKKVGWVKGLLEKEGLKLRESHGTLCYGSIDRNRLRLSWDRGIILLNWIFPGAGKIEFYYQAASEDGSGLWQIDWDTDPADQEPAQERNLQTIVKKIGLDRLKNPVPDSDVERLVRDCVGCLRSTSFLQIA